VPDPRQGISIEFDRFGDFAGFRLVTESGAGMHFYATDEALERLIRDAWRHRSTITVVTEAHTHIEHPIAFILRKPGRR
jgi:hypothetical protein